MWGLLAVDGGAIVFSSSVVGCNMDKRDDHPLVDSIREASLCADENIEFVVAFGSQFTGDSTDGSDLDIAVKFAGGLSASERFTKRCFLSGDLQADEMPFVEISDIETLPVDVAHNAINGTLCVATNALSINIEKLSRLCFTITVGNVGAASVS